MASVPGVPGLTTSALRRGLFAAFAASAVGGAGVAALVAPAATAAQDPCAASEVAKTVGSVVTATGNYLDGHPDTNQALTTISEQQAGPQSVAAVKAYFDANPLVGKEMQTLQSPLVALSTRCRLPVTLPQLVGLLQAAQQPQPPQPAASPGVGALPGSVVAGVH